MLVFVPVLIQVLIQILILVLITILMLILMQCQARARSCKHRARWLVRDAPRFAELEPCPSLAELAVLVSERGAPLEAGGHGLVVPAGRALGPRPFEPLVLLLLRLRLLLLLPLILLPYYDYHTTTINIES